MCELELVFLLRPNNKIVMKNKVRTLITGTLCFAMMVFLTDLEAQNVGINSTGATPNNSSILDLSSTNKGFLPPRMTTAERNAIPTNCSCTPPDGLLIFNTDDHCLQMYDQGTWYSMGCANCGDPASISSQPANSAISSGDNTSFSVTASGTGTLTYQWQESTDGGTTWNNISNGGTNPAYSNATTASLTLNNVPVGHNNYQYRCIVSGTCPPAANSNSATLTVSSCPTWMDDFSGTDDWTDQHADVGVNTTSDELDYRFVKDNVNRSSVIALSGAAANTWVLRFKLDVQTIVGPGSSAISCSFGLYNSNGSTAGSGNQDAIVFLLKENGLTEHELNLSWGDNTSSYINRTLLTRSLQVEVLYVELKRTSSTGISVEIFSDSGYTTSLEGPITDVIPNTITGLQYLGWKNSLVGSNPMNGEVSGIVDDVEFCDGVTSW